jgi:hypothetical protein
MGDAWMSEIDDAVTAALDLRRYFDNGTYGHAARLMDVLEQPVLDDVTGLRARAATTENSNPAEVIVDSGCPVGDPRRQGRDQHSH